MKAFAITPGSPGSGRVRDVAAPPCSGAQTLVEVIAVGVDGTDRELRGVAKRRLPGRCTPAAPGRKLREIREGRGFRAFATARSVAHWPPILPFALIARRSYVYTLVRISQAKACEMAAVVRRRIARPERLSGI
jgi:hypothetical protein